MGTRALWVFVVFGALLSSGCRERSCARGTVLLEYSIPSSTPLPVQATIAVTIDGATKTTPVTLSRLEGSVQIDFPQGYPDGKTVYVEIDSPILVGASSVGLSSSCAVLMVPLSPTSISDLAAPADSSLGDLAVISDQEQSADLTEAPYLTGLTISSGFIEPAFQPTVVDYAVDVRLFVATVRVTATAQALDSIKINGVDVASGAPSAFLSLNLGETVIPIEVTGSTGTRTYNLTVRRGGDIDYIKASYMGADRVGSSVAISGNTLVVGAPYEDSGSSGVNTTPTESLLESGAAYVFVYSGGAWQQQAYLKASNVDNGDNFGSSVAISGDTIVIGAPSEDSAVPGINVASDESAPGAGAAYVFVRTSGVWSEQAYLKALNCGYQDQFGYTVSISGNSIAVGAPGEGTSTGGINVGANEAAPGAGAAYVFVRTGTTWAQQAFIKASNAEGGDNFGTVAIDGDTLVVGAPAEDSATSGINTTPDENAAFAGAAYIFVRSGSTWSQQAYVKPSNTGSMDGFGRAVSVSGDAIVVSAPGESTGKGGINPVPDEDVPYAGAVYVFRRAGTAWTQEAFIKASNPGLSSYGRSVTLVGDVVAVGAPGESGSGMGINPVPDSLVSASGAVYVYSRVGGIWEQWFYVKSSNTGENDAFGESVAYDSFILAVGAPAESSSTIGINTAPNENTPGTGAVYTY